MKMFFTAFGLHNPCAIRPFQEHCAFPIGIDTKDGIDLDYSAILLAEKFVIDKSAREFVRDRSRGFLKPMNYSLNVLADEGLLEEVEFKDKIHGYEDAIKSKTIGLLENVEPWVAIARKQWTELKPELAEFQSLYGRSCDAGINVAHFGILNYLEANGKHLTSNASGRLHKLFEVRRNRLTKSEKAEIREILQPLVAQVLVNDLVRKKLNAPLIDWDDAQGFYQRLHIGQWTELEDSGFPTIEATVQARCLFSIVIPELLPQRIEDIVKFVNKKHAVRSLRHELWELLRNGKGVSREWMIQLLNEATKAQLRAEKRSRIVKWVGRIAGIAVPGGEALGGIVLEGAGKVLGALGEIVMDGATEAAEDYIGKSGKDKFEWYYALQHLKQGA